MILMIWAGPCWSWWAIWRLPAGLPLVELTVEHTFARAHTRARTHTHTQHTMHTNTHTRPQDIFDKVDKSGEGVCVQASTLGSLEALLAFLDSDDVAIPVSGINIGPVHKKDVLRANVMAEKGVKKVGGRGGGGRGGYYPYI